MKQHAASRASNQIGPAYAKRILQDWIEDNDHVAMIKQYWPDLFAAYEWLKSVAESPAVETKPNEAIPVAWMRGHRMHTPDGDDYDVECYYGSDPPDDKKWVPLYREQPKHTYSTSADLRRLLTRARNFIVSNYVDGDLPAFDKPDGLCDDILAALNGSDAPPPSPVKATTEPCLCGRGKDFHPWRFCNEYKTAPKCAIDKTCLEYPRCRCGSSGNGTGDQT